MRDYSVAVASFDTRLAPRELDSLDLVLRTVDPPKRPQVALEFLSLTSKEWSIRAGLHPNYAWRWALKRQHLMPFYAAVWLADAIGQSAELLFEDWAKEKP